MFQVAGKTLAKETQAGHLSSSLQVDSILKWELLAGDADGKRYVILLDY